MKNKISIVRTIGIIILFLLSGVTLQAYNTYDDYDDYYYSYYQDEDIGMNLDLRVVASLFGRSENLNELEYRLNDPSLRINNLDLDYDGYVDYLRLLEMTDDNLHLIIIQAVLGPDLYQDVATIEVSRDYRGRTFVQIIGNSYLYGEHYIIEPRFSYTPLIYKHFWRRGYYHPYYSHFHWKHYPSHYRPWRSTPLSRYYRNVHRHINHQNHYKRTHIRKSHRARKIYRDIRRGAHIHHRTKDHLPIYHSKYRSIRHNKKISTGDQRRIRSNRADHIKLKNLFKRDHSNCSVANRSSTRASRKYPHHHSRKRLKRSHHSHYPHHTDR